jgi:hypothetical protein
MDFDVVPFVAGLHWIFVIDVRCTGDEKAKTTSINSTMTELPISTVLMSFDTTNYCILKFWLLALGGVAIFFAWLVLFTRCAGIWGLGVALSAPFNTLPTHIENTSTAAGPVDMTSSANKKSTGSAGLFYVDVWFALALMAAVDAFAIVINFNRSLIHQFHYFISLRMMSLAFVISVAVLLLSGNEHNNAQKSQHPAAVIFLCCVLYMVSIFATEKLHKLLPVRGTSATRGSLQEFSQQMCLFDLPWRRALLFAATNGVVGLVLTTLVPTEWSMLNPVVHITWEV